MHNKVVKKCTKHIGKNIKICYPKKEVELMKLTKKGYMPRLIDKVIEKNLEVLVQLVLKDQSGVERHGMH